VYQTTLGFPIARLEETGPVSLVGPCLPNDGFSKWVVAVDEILIAPMEPF